MTDALLAFAGATLVSPFLALLGSRLIEWAKQREALARLRRDPLYDVGSVLRNIRRGGTVLIHRCCVHSLATGRVEVRGLDARGDSDGTAMSWTVREFEGLDPTAEV